MTINVIPLRENRPSLQDIPGCLRRLADEIESKPNDVHTLFVVIPVSGEFPDLRGFGDVDGDRGPIVQLALAQHALLASCSRRSGH